VLLGTMANDIVNDRTPTRILAVRAQMYDLLTHCIPATNIIKTLAFKLVELVDDDLKGEVILFAATYESRIKEGTKMIFHLEAFVVKIMKMIEEHLMSVDM
jgi:replication factor C subunit 3/5